MDNDLERELGLALPSLGTLEVEGIPVEGGEAVVQIVAHLPNDGGVARLQLSVDAAKETGEAILAIVAQLEELR